MKKLLIILSLFITTSVFGQWDPLQSVALADSLSARDATLDSLGVEIALLSSETMLPLAATKVYIGSSLGLPVAQSVTGALSVTNLGVWSINSGYITNSMLSSSANIDPSKIGTSGGYTIDDNEYYALDGVTSNIQEQFDAINYGTGFLATSGGTLTGDLNMGDGIKLRLGDSQDLQLYHSGTYAWIYNTTGEMILRNVASAKISFYTGDTERWDLSSAGHLIPFVTDTYNIGSTSSQPDSVYANVVYADGVNLGGVLATHSTTTEVQGFISDSLLARKLDPIVFSIGDPQDGDVIGPFRVHRDVTITSEYLYLSGASSTVNYNVFYHTSVNTDAVAGTGSETPLFVSDEVGSPTTGVQVDSDNSNIYEATPDEGEWIWCKIVSVTGSPTRFSLTLNKSGR